MNFDCFNLSSDAFTVAGASVYPDSQICGRVCGCDYVAFESFLKDLPELQSRRTDENGKNLEAEIREKITQYSRLFDELVGVESGFFSKAHKCKKTITFESNGTSRIEIGQIIASSLEVAKDGKLVDAASLKYIAGFLIFKPCTNHILCGCPIGCSGARIKKSIPFPAGCYEISARWGRECADRAVEAAVKAYVLKSFRTLDPATAAQAGIQPSYSNTPPYEWKSLVEVYKQRYGGASAAYLMC